MDKKEPDVEYGEQETARRRDEALRRALNTPAKPQKDVRPKQRKGSQPPRRNKERE